MKTVPDSTGEIAEDKPREWRSPQPPRYYPAVIENELSSTEREWAAKPPPGMESERFTEETIRRDLG